MADPFLLTSPPLCSVVILLFLCAVVSMLQQKALLGPRMSSHGVFAAGPGLRGQVFAAVSEQSLVVLVQTGVIGHAVNAQVRLHTSAQERQLTNSERSTRSILLFGHKLQQLLTDRFRFVIFDGTDKIVFRPQVNSAGAISQQHAVAAFEVPRCEDPEEFLAFLGSQRLWDVPHYNPHRCGDAHFVPQRGIRA